MTRSPSEGWCSRFLSEKGLSDPEMKGKGFAVNSLWSKDDVAGSSLL